MKRLATAALAVVACMGCKEEKVAKPQASRAVQVAMTNSAATVADTIAFPAGPEGIEARRGFAILAATRDSMPSYVGNGLRCFSCHLDSGRRANAIPLTGVHARYPSY
ncbi:MAG: cytochrome C, partial [Gemmatimonadales bacterium]